MVTAVSKRLSVRVEKVDSNGLLPLRATTKEFTTAFSFRAFLQKQLPPHLSLTPTPDPLAGIKLPELKSLPVEFLHRWPPATKELLHGTSDELARLPIDHSVEAVDYRGGPTAATNRLVRFLAHSLEDYTKRANQPDDDRA